MAAGRAHPVSGAERAEQVLGVVEDIPPGRVMSYGDVAGALGWRGARHVGRIMAHWGGEVPWWRVVRADGTLPAPLWAEAQAHYDAEDTPLAPGGRRVDMGRARWDPLAS